MSNTDTLDELGPPLPAPSASLPAAPACAADGAAAAGTGKAAAAAAAGEADTADEPPVLQPAESEAAAAQSQDPGLVAGDSSLTVLYMDDSGVARKMFARAISKSGFAVCTVADGETALAMMESEPAKFACLITDVVTPTGTMDGLELLQRVKESAVPALHSTPVLMLTSLGTNAAILCSQLGADGFLQKPANTEALVRKLVALTRPASGSGT